MMATKRACMASLIIALGVLSGCGKEREKPAALSSAGVDLRSGALNSVNFAETLKNYSTGLVKPAPWAGYWFPYGAGGIGFVAGKYDQVYAEQMRAQGRDMSGYKTVSAWEAYNHVAGVPNFEPWFGHCNGWAASSLMVPEPRDTKTVGSVSFGVGEQKALLAESWLEFSGDFVGSRVNDKGDYSSAAFWDIVPAQFHLMMANIVGKQNKGLILDRHTGHEIWNQPLAGYKFEPVKQEDYLGAHPQFPNIYRVNVTTRIWWANDNVGADDISPVFDLERLANEYYDQYYPGRVLHYELWLDGPIEFDSAGNMVSSGDILVTQENGRYVGGVWKNASSPEGLLNSHPDYLWVPYGIQHSSGYKNPYIDDIWVRDNIAGMVHAN